MLTRRRLLATAAATPPAAALAAGAADPATAAGGSVAGKNILIFITDQQRKVVHFPAGWEKENLPGLTRLKKHGISFENAFCNTAMCSPSRATLFTGLYPAQHGVKYTLEQDMPVDDHHPQVQLSTDLVNLASVMKAAGYEVVFKGKWQLSLPLGEEWTPEDLAQYGFDRWSPPDGGANEDIDEAGGGLANHDGHYMLDDGDAADGAEGVLKFINERAGATQPWCLIVCLVNPHDVLLYPGLPTEDPPKYVQAGYGDPAWFEGPIGLPVTYNEDLSTKPSCQAEFLKLLAIAGPLPTRQDKLSYLNFYANLHKVADGYLVDILDTLQWTNQLDDTLVVRTADHGELGLAHQARQKSFNGYEETINLPLVFSNPKLYPRARTSHQLVSHVDLLPTLASLVDAPSSARSPDWAGIDYSPHVLGHATEPTQDHVVFTFDDWQSGQPHGPYVPPPNRIVMVRERRWKLAKYYDADGHKRTEWEMYDLKKDPLERHNLAYRPHLMSAWQRAHFRRLKGRIHHIEQTTLQPLPTRSA